MSTNEPTTPDPQGPQPTNGNGTDTPGPTNGNASNGRPFGQRGDTVTVGGLPRPELVENGHGFQDVTKIVSRVILEPTPTWWWPAFLISFGVLFVGVAMAIYLIATGVGVWGENQPVGWAFDITNFVFWIGIGHAGTLISAILFLFRQKWRTSINRAAEAMTLFAVACAGIFPTIHVGRFWVVWYMAPLPNSNAIWPNFRSPLLWDVFAVSTYATVSIIFWYLGLIPDLSTMRDKTRGLVSKIYGFFAMGWRNSARQWRHYEGAYILLACLSTPLVLSVHTVVSFDFATSVIPGWHTTIFPPYFVAGAIFGGFAMVVTLMVPTRALYKLHDLVTIHHLENMCKIMLATGMIVGYAYAMELFIAWYGGNIYERFAFLNRVTGPYWWAYWSMVTCNVFVPQLFWFKYFRTNPWAMWVISIFINIGMWFERFVIIVTSLHRDFLPSSWGYFTPTWVDALQLIGSFGLFVTLYLIFIRLVPVIAIAEVKGVLPNAHPHHDHNHDHHDSTSTAEGGSHA